MKWVLFVALLTFFSLGCEKNGMTDSTSSDEGIGKYIPLKTGNTWIYKEDTSTGTVSVYKTNALVGGQVSSYVLKLTDNKNEEEYLSFFNDHNTLYTYLGNAANPFSTDYLYWYSGGISGAAVAVDQQRTFSMLDSNRSAVAFSLVRAPDPAVAAAAVVSGYQLQIRGLAAGFTTLLLKKTNGLPKDTLTVYIEVDATIRMTGPSLPVWLPVWRLTNSTSEETVFSWDTTYSWRRFSNRALYSDELNYIITNRFVGEDQAVLDQKTIQCEKFESKAAVHETIVCQNSSGTVALFSGASSGFTAEVWLASGIGCVKLIVNGNTLLPAVGIAGARDSSGVLHGYYISPRLRYAIIDESNPSSEYFSVDTTSLAASPALYVYTLISKNF